MKNRDFETNQTPSMETILKYEISPSIVTLLKAEIKTGNEVAEISKGWPKQNSVLIIMKKPFIKKYTINGLKYRHVNAPHYWKEEYSNETSMQTIACRF
ncbi:hypothetical protein [uncultured Tenacibaculum sp.]|uniref:hypothetical protein n=1 Tax=uncultured Tenacibaculum sp. TaxID=174713 RepID=UPI00260CD628|nr:hypothetical protein [uncultured Tenacibaculum sp.]